MYITKINKKWRNVHKKVYDKWHLQIALTQQKKSKI